MPKLTDQEKRDRAINRTYERYLCLTIGKVKNDVLKEFQLLRRLECTSEFASLPAYGVECISCDKLITDYKQADAGHFISRKHTAVAFARNNVWLQCKHCNQYLSGNQAEYRKRLIERIGEEEVRLLEAWKDAPIVFNKHQYAQMKEAYRSLVNKEKERLWI